MGLRDKINIGLKDAMKAKDNRKISTLRLINAAIKDQDIALRAESKELSETDITQLLSKMVKQRQESAHIYEEGGRLELAEQEREEITFIEAYLPRQLDAAEVEKAISDAISDTKATSIRDMGKVMGALKMQYTGQIDFGAVGAIVKARLNT